MSNKVELTLDLTCIKDNSAPREFEWHLTQHVYLTSHFNRSPVIAMMREGTTTRVKVSGELPFEAQGKIPATAAVCFAATALHRNDNGVPVMVDVGTSHIMLAEMMNKPNFIFTLPSL